MKILKMTIIMLLGLFVTSCCVYHNSNNVGDKKISEYGIAISAHNPALK